MCMVMEDPSVFSKNCVSVYLITIISVVFIKPPSLSCKLGTVELAVKGFKGVQVCGRYHLSLTGYIIIFLYSGCCVCMLHNNCIILLIFIVIYCNSIAGYKPFRYLLYVVALINRMFRFVAVRGYSM